MSYQKFKESPSPEPAKSSQLGMRNKTNGTVVRVKVTIDPEFTPVVPVVIPHIEAVRAFAQKLHERNVDWQGNAFGWDAEYHASSQEKPLHSKMTFTPAEFWIGDATIWGVSMMWEGGDQEPPSEAISDWNILADEVTN